MSRSLRAGLHLGILLAAAAFPLAAQDSTIMKKDSMAMKHDAMMDKTMKPDAMGAMGHDAMMAPHGMFAGVGNHQAAGAWSVEMKDGKTFLVLAPDFSIDKVPDPYVVLTSSGKGMGSGTLNLGKLKSVKGAARLEIPAGTDLKTYATVLIWCKQYDVNLAQSPLAPADAMMHN
ncbi:MAG: DM13 domain-containing protein [Gemmatimonadota bacterium]|nr:DM13 domain-containing protein [Gemmatimonadota bacterium]